MTDGDDSLVFQYGSIYGGLHTERDEEKM